MAHDSIRAAMPELREALLANVLLSGGSTLFPGLVERVRREMVTLAGGLKVNVIAPPERKVRRERERERERERRAREAFSGKAHRRSPVLNLDWWLRLGLLVIM
jgi:hypothetical protein